MPYSSDKPVKQYGPVKMDHGPKMMGKPSIPSPPALLMKCGYKRHIGKKK